MLEKFLHHVSAYLVNSARRLVLLEWVMARFLPEAFEEALFLLLLLGWLDVSCCGRKDKEIVINERSSSSSSNSSYESKMNPVTSQFHKSIQKNGEVSSVSSTFMAQTWQMKLTIGLTEVRGNEDCEAFIKYFISPETQWMRTTLRRSVVKVCQVKQLLDIQVSYQNQHRRGDSKEWPTSSIEGS